MKFVSHSLNIPELLVSVTQFGFAQSVKFPANVKPQRGRPGTGMTFKPRLYLPFKYSTAGHLQMVKRVT